MNRTLPRPLHTKLIFTLALAACALAAQGASEEPRFEPIKIDGIWYKFDRVTGKSVPLDVPGPKEGAPAKGELSKDSSDAAQEPGERPRDAQRPRKNRRPEIVLPGDPPDQRSAVGEEADYVPHEITDTHRRLAAREVAGYKDEIGIAAPLQLNGDNITGTINAENKGKRKLLALELTVFIPTGEAKPYEHHVLFSFQTGREPPPAPNLGPAQKGRAANHTLNFPVPGVVKGKFDVKVTYLKFDE